MVEIRAYDASDACREHSHKYRAFYNVLTYVSIKWRSRKFRQQHRPEYHHHRHHHHSVLVAECDGKDPADFL